jgi:tRNA pseudouridine32 synthase/23S rRNA pseudouridine746 synthase
MLSQANRPALQPDELRLLHVDESLLVISKPAGLLAVAGRGVDKQDCAASRVQASYPGALVVHRLDQATSGLMVLARDLQTQRRMGQLFSRRQVHKCYVALLDGRLEPRQGQIDLPLLADWPERPKQKVDLDRGKPSLTRWRVLDYDASDDRSRVLLEPVTGRTHQLRVHMQALGHAVLGDTLYGAAVTQANAERLLLHAWTLAFAHPSSGEAVSFEDPVPF